jgi:hypothetical protein
LAKFGPNALPEKKVNPILEFLMFMWNPLSWVMEAAVGLVELDCTCKLLQYKPNLSFLKTGNEFGAWSGFLVH